MLATTIIKVSVAAVGLYMLWKAARSTSVLDVTFYTGGAIFAAIIATGNFNP